MRVLRKPLFRPLPCQDPSLGTASFSGSCLGFRLVPSILGCDLMERTGRAALARFFNWLLLAKTSRDSESGNEVL